MADNTKKYSDASNGYRGVYSDSESSFPVYFGDAKSNSRPISPLPKFSKKDLDSYNLASIRILPSTSDLATDPYFNTTTDLANRNKNVKVTNEYVGFILIQVTEQHAEKFETVNLAGDSFASFFYGAQVPVYQFTGVTLNTLQDNWRDSFEILYRTYARGSASIRNKTIVQIKYDQRIVTGYVSEFSQVIQADTQNTAQFSIRIVVLDITYLNKDSQDAVALLKKFSREINLVDALRQSGLQSKLLNSERLKQAREYSRVGFLVPPPAPPKPKSAAKSSIATCIDRPPQKDDGTKSDTEDTIIYTGATDSRCFAADGWIQATQEFNKSNKELADTIAKLNATNDPTKIAELTAKANELQNRVLDSGSKIQDYNNPESELSKAVTDQQIQELEDNSKVISQISSQKNSIAVRSNVTKDKVVIAVPTNTSQFSDPEYKSKNPGMANTVAKFIVTTTAATVLGKDFVSDTQATEQIAKSTTELEKAKTEANKRAASASKKDSDQTMEIVE